jgi:hypothetical protein
VERTKRHRPPGPLDAALVGHAVVGRMSEHLSHGTRPSRAEVARIVEFCVAR